MKNMKRSLFAFLLLSMGMANAQTKLEKTNQTIKVSKDVTLDLNTNYCTIELDTWNKNTIEIEAYIEGGKIAKEELQEALKNWDLTIDATTNNVSITSKNGTSNLWHHQYGSDDNVFIIQDLKHELADVPEIHLEHLNYIVLPEVSELPELPELPVIPHGISDIHFDYKAYQKDGKKYLEKWTAKFDKKFGKDYEQKMEAWAKKYEQKMEAWEEKMEQKNEWIEERAEKNEKLLEKRLAQKEKLLEKRNQNKDIIIKKRKANKTSLFNSNIKKTIRIRMPKKTKVKMNVRHGELNLVSNIDNLNATLAYTKLAANSINGRNTSINASYSPLAVTNWNYGKLNLNYVDNAALKNVESIVLTTNSSNIEISNLGNNAVIDGNYGDVKILNINEEFSNLNMMLQNSNAIIVLPKTTHNVLFTGKQSRLLHPKKTTKNKVNSFVNGDANNPKRIVVNANYSVINMK